MMKITVQDMTGCPPAYKIVDLQSGRQSITKGLVMMTKVKVAVIFGGASNEHDVSLVSATHVIKSIPKDRYEVIQIGITRKGRWLFFPGDVSEIENGEWEKSPDCCTAILSPDPIHHGFLMVDGEHVSVRKVDVIFPVLHGKNGEDGTIQGIFTMSGIPFVGCDTISSAMCMDKDYTHTVLEMNGIATANWRAIRYSEIAQLEKRCAEIEKQLGMPLFVKPACCGSSVGVSKAHNYDELVNAVKLAFTHDKKVVVEQNIDGKELECAVFGDESPFASGIGEIEPTAEFYDFDAKYKDNTTNLYIPARIDAETAKEIREIAVKAFKAMGCSGLSRVDFFLTKRGQIILNEINTLPGFTPISMYAKLLAEMGIGSEELVVRLIELALSK